MFRYRTFHIFLSLVIGLLILAGCRKEIVPKAFYPRSAHEAYQHSLEKADLNNTALGREWIQAGEAALNEPLDIRLPFEDAFQWDSNRANAAGYRFFVKRGLRVEVRISVIYSDTLLLFADLFRERGDTTIE